MSHARRMMTLFLVLAGLAVVRTASAAEIPPYLPYDTEYVVGWNVAGFVDSPLVKKHDRRSWPNTARKL